MGKRVDCIIIGAGIGGLTAASLLAKKGYKVKVFEKQKSCGGYAQNFKRRDFTFDASLHSISSPDASMQLSDLLANCGVLDKVQFIKHKYLFRLIAPDLDIRIKNADIDGLVRQLEPCFPEERTGMRALLNEIGKAHDSVLRMDRSRLPTILNLLLFPFLYPKLVKYDRATVDQVMTRFISDEKLIATLSSLWSFFGLPPKRLSFSYFFFPFIDYLTNGGCTVKGGSENLTRAFVESIRDNGGEVFTNSDVQEIVVSGRNVRGIRTAHGEFLSPRIISNISPMTTMDLAGNGHFKEKYVSAVQDQKIAISGIQIYLGLDCTLESLGVDPDDYLINLSDTYDQEDQYLKCLKNDFEHAGGGFGITCFSNLDKSMAPEGKATLSLFSLAGGKEWFEYDETTYRRKKKEVTELLIKKAERFIPGLSDHIEVAETATPRTLWRYTGNPEGTFHGFEQSVPQAGVLRRFSRKYPLKGLYQVGAWTFPGGGYAGAMFSAKQLVGKYFK